MRQRMNGVVPAILIVGLAAVSLAAVGSGRYKKDGAKCVWDANDSGPNQCTPMVEGRFKKAGDACTWVAEKGADDCRPSKGRFKQDGNACLWNATDSGPDQCDPRRIK